MQQPAVHSYGPASGLPELIAALRQKLLAENNLSEVLLRLAFADIQGITSAGVLEHLLMANSANEHGIIA